MYKTLVIEYGSDCQPVEYRLRDHPVVQRWAECVIRAQQQQYPIDDPDRFYGFGSRESQVEQALAHINVCIAAIQLCLPELDRGPIANVADQDSLNYWHHVFETYHGLLGEESGTALDSVLADLNVAVHRCESIARGARPRHVVTYYGLPKTETFLPTDYRYFEDTWQPGTVFVNYVEIGKTLADLARDNDHYIKLRAFRPYHHLSADFNVKFYGQTDLQAQANRARMHEYYQYRMKDIVDDRPELWVEHLPVADIVGSVDLDFFAQRQTVRSVTLI
jgi:hypothetical protein